MNASTSAVKVADWFVNPMANSPAIREEAVMKVRVFGSISCSCRMVRLDLHVLQTLRSFLMLGHASSGPHVAANCGAALGSRFFRSGGFLLRRGGNLLAEQIIRHCLAREILSHRARFLQFFLDFALYSGKPLVGGAGKVKVRLIGQILRLGECRIGPALGLAQRPIRR